MFARAAFLAVCALALFALCDAPAFAGVESTSLTVKLTNPTAATPFCEDLRIELESRYVAMRRFIGAKMRGRHQLAIRCGDPIEVRWSARFGKRTATVTSVNERQNDLERLGAKASALVIEQRLAANTPWAGEVSAIFSAATPWRKVSGPDPEPVVTDLSSESAVASMAKVQLAIGSVTDVEMGSCLTIDIGRLVDDKDGRVTFVSLGYGIVVGVERFAAYAVAKLNLPKKPADVGALYFRHELGVRKSTALESLRRTCLGQTFGNGDLTFADMSKKLFSKETIELNGVDQSVGIAPFALKSTNGYGLPLGVAAYVRNHVHIGALAVNAFFAREAIPSRYEGGAAADTAAISVDPSSSTNPEAHIAVLEGYVNGVLGRGSWLLEGGPGLFYWKANVPWRTMTTTTYIDPTDASGEPIEVVEPTIGKRPTIFAPAFDLIARRVAGDISLYGNLAGSFSSEGAHVSFTAGVDYKLTAAWYFGVEGYAMRYGASNVNAPGGTFTLIGAHLGFDIQRDRRGDKK